MLRNIFGQKENKINIEELMNDQKIILINLSKGKIGEENSSFFGAMFLTKIKQAGMARAKLDPKDRLDFYLYVDEFHNIVTNTFENLLSESRKYGINLTIATIAHQYIGQLLPKVEQAVLGNTGSIICFRVGGDDAVKLKPEFAPIFDVKDMINLGIGEFYIKMTIDGESYDPFSAETLQVLPATHSSYRRQIIEASRRKYAIAAGDAEKLIAEEEATIIRSAQEKAAIISTSKKIELKSDKLDNTKDKLDNIKDKLDNTKKENKIIKKESDEPLI